LMLTNHTLNKSKPMKTNRLNPRFAWERESIRHSLTKYANKLGADIDDKILSVNSVLMIIDEIDEENQSSLVRSAVDLLGFTMDEIRSDDRRTNFVFARHFISKYLHLQGWTLTSIGYTLNRHHSTIINSIRAMDNLLSYDAEVKNDFGAFYKAIEERRMCINVHNEVAQKVDNQVSL